MPATGTPLRALLTAVKADPEGCPVWGADVTVAEARAWLDQPGDMEGHPLMDQLDEAQGTSELDDESGEAFIVIRIRRA